MPKGLLCILFYVRWLRAGVLVDANISYGHTRLSVTPKAYAIQYYNLSYHSVLWSNL